MFKKKIPKLKKGIPSLLDKEPEDPLPELPKFDEETEEDIVPEPIESVKEVSAVGAVEDLDEEEAEDEESLEDEIPDEIDMEDEDIKEKEEKIKPVSKDIVPETEIKSDEEVVTKQFYTPVAIESTENGFIKTTIISNIDLKLVVGEMYDMEEGMGNAPSPPQEFTSNQDMSLSGKKMCLGCYKVLDMEQNCDCPRQKQEQLGYKPTYVKS